MPLTTQGDRIHDRALADVGGKGLFVKELELALLENRADIAVHSMKDVPSSLPPELVIAAALARANPRDAFVSLRHRRFADLPDGAAIGTSSPRRQSQLRAARPDLAVRLLRGNVDTRLARLADGALDGDRARLCRSRAAGSRGSHHRGAERGARRFRPSARA